MNTLSFILYELDLKKVLLKNYLQAKICESE